MSALPLLLVLNSVIGSYELTLPPAKTTLALLAPVPKTRGPSPYSVLPPQKVQHFHFGAEAPLLTIVLGTVGFFLSLFVSVGFQVRRMAQLEELESASCSDDTLRDIVSDYEEDEAEEVWMDCTHW